MSEPHFRVHNERLRAAVLDSGMTVELVAAKAGVDRKTLERWIGGRVPHPHNRHALADVLGIHPSDLWPDADPLAHLVSDDLAGDGGLRLPQPVLG